MPPRHGCEGSHLVRCFRLRRRNGYAAKPPGQTARLIVVRLGCPRVRISNQAETSVDDLVGCGLPAAAFGFCAVARDNMATASGRWNKMHNPSRSRAANSAEFKLLSEKYIGGSWRGRGPDRDVRKVEELVLPCEGLGIRQRLAHEQGSRLGLWLRQSGVDRLVGFEFARDPAQQENNQPAPAEVI